MKLKKIHSFRFSVLAAALVLLSLVQFGSPAFAAVNSANIQVSPAELQIEVSSQKNQQTQTVTVTNNYDVTIAMSAELKAIDEASGLLVPAGQLDESVASALKLSETDFDILPHSTKTLTVQANNTSQLGPGGHYATILLTQRASEQQQLSLRSAISVNVFFIKRDGARQSIKLDSLKASNWLFHMTNQAKMTFSNDGNVRSTPHGAVTIERSNGTVLAKGIANEGSQPLLPGKSLTSDISLKKISGVWYPQKLTFAATYRADDLQEVTKTYHFWYIPPVYLIIPIAIITLILLYLIKRNRIKKSKRKHSKKVATIPKKIDYRT